jgi:uncharacterized membrane protein YhaH (DUF805 family)
VIAVLSPYCLTAVVVKRLHDLDRSGWHAFVLVVAFFFAGLAALAYEGRRQHQITLEEWRNFWTTVFYVTAALAVALFAYLLVKLGFTRGTLVPTGLGPTRLQQWSSRQPKGPYDLSFRSSSDWRRCRVSRDTEHSASAPNQRCPLRSSPRHICRHTQRDPLLPPTSMSYKSAAALIMACPR